MHCMEGQEDGEENDRGWGGGGGGLKWRGEGAKHSIPKTYMLSLLLASVGTV